MKEKGITPIDLKNPIISPNVTKKAVDNDNFSETELLEKSEDIQD